MNVLRQYDETQVGAAWQEMRSRLAPGGLVFEGTCDEVGRRMCVVVLDANGPQRLVLAAHVGSLERPGVLAERLPKALIHHNVPGHPVYELLAAAGHAWDAAAGPFGPRQRWLATVSGMREAGWPVLDGPARWRLGELTVPWSAVVTARA
jgi:hypothetical protein